MDQLLVLSILRCIFKVCLEPLNGLSRCNRFPGLFEEDMYAAAFVIHVAVFDFEGLVLLGQTI